MIKAEINKSAHGPKLATETMANPQVSLSGLLAFHVCQRSHSISVQANTVSRVSHLACFHRDSFLKIQGSRKMMIVHFHLKEIKLLKKKKS